MGGGLALLVLLPQKAEQAAGDKPGRKLVSGPRGLLSRASTRFSDLLARAGWAELSPTTVLGLWGSASVGLGALVLWLIPIPALSPLATVAVVLAGAGLLQGRVERRDRALRGLWPGVVDQLRQAVRSGAGVGEAVWSVAEMVPGDLRGAFSRYREVIDTGQPVDAALVELKTQLANPVADRIIEALRMAHEVGGPELPRILADLQSSVRADWQVREDALARQAWIRAASKLGVAAPWLVLVMLSGRAEAQAAYSSPAGVGLLVVGCLVSAFAYRLMRRLGTLPPERRWFQ